MFNFIRGKLVTKHPAGLVIEVPGFGYDIAVPLSTYAQLPEVGEEVCLYTHLHMREDAWNIFGFISLEEKEMFKLLISISGIGPKVALTILSGIGINAFREAVHYKDLPALTAISGVGKKTAERIIVELKEKIDFDTKAIYDKEAPQEISFASQLEEDAAQALIALGYKKPQAQKAIQKVVEKDKEITVEELIRKSLLYI